ncbi:hypothetical protein BDFB_004953 [Asbolus verrucosus]|uniref:Uncharacterized protein n=1 Tax=Asbolus verrucosus TaxID=1661398 RepID=A0A482W6Q0_ASBVE|nr:hypothetical protein BDFB_004953 [Asbolus verrucosus]
MKKEAAKGTYVIPVTSYKQRVMEATGISEKIYRQICKEMGLIEAGVINSFSSPS